MRILYTKKQCSKCKKDKVLKSFGKDKQKKDGLYSSCRRCHNKASREGTTPLRRKHNRLKLDYNITIDTYNLMLGDQNGKCAICKGVNKSGRALAVDHDHKTGKVRQLLCGSCNTILGTAYDNIEILKTAIKYLEGHSY